MAREDKLHKFANGEVVDATMIDRAGCSETFEPLAWRKPKPGEYLPENADGILPEFMAESGSQIHFAYPASFIYEVRPFWEYQAEAKQHHDKHGNPAGDGGGSGQPDNDGTQEAGSGGNEPSPTQQGPEASSGPPTEPDRQPDSPPKRTGVSSKKTARRRKLTDDSDGRTVAIGPVKDV